jgi:hypothetical protein
MWDSYVTHGLESPTNRLRARKTRNNIAQPSRKRGAPRGPRRRPLLYHNRLLNGRMNRDAFYGNNVVRFMSPARGMTRWFVHRLRHTYPKEDGNCADLRPKTDGIIWFQDSRRILIAVNIGV